MHKFQSKLSNKYDQNIVESGVKHHNPNPNTLSYLLGIEIIL
jgi:hypothetical protein